MIRKIRKQFELIRGKRLHSFDDFDPIIRRCLKEYAHLFPQHTINMAGSKVVYHFNVEEVDPISLEREHGSRDSVPRRYAKFAIAGIEDLLAFIENATAMEPAAEEVESDEGKGDSKHSDEHGPAKGTEGDPTTPDPEIPD